MPLSASVDRIYCHVGVSRRPNAFVSPVLHAGDSFMKEGLLDRLAVSLALASLHCTGRAPARRDSDKCRLQLDPALNQTLDLSRTSLEDAYGLLDTWVSWDNDMIMLVHSLWFRALRYK
ncbi:hypothetical protein PCANC_14262 [Puccinia coronata f. sp. avenae]|uniref:Uncharacterized protein n=1 Tax=Puccinia coronata f. sp. avenae TaxID=200324 RepID=A0A2N5SRK8_9BASI|nr:hypothetical protein PCANC_14262 [Puccinia coronata f. sp. avenae]PLW22864.1 hypothetical protein PCASD_16210 [Puccinia coronata f. sp. avenae]PLW42265.1 hypothetical protein PCASD_07736 [Puccinia coronata f. sp. avenae]